VGRQDGRTFKTIETTTGGDFGDRRRIRAGWHEAADYAFGSNPPYELIPSDTAAKAESSRSRRIRYVIPPCALRLLSTTLLQKRNETRGQINKPNEVTNINPNRPNKPLPIRLDNPFRFKGLNKIIHPIKPATINSEASKVNAKNKEIENHASNNIPTTVVTTTMATMQRNRYINLFLLMSMSQVIAATKQPAIDQQSAASNNGKLTVPYPLVESPSFPIACSILLRFDEMLSQTSADTRNIRPFIHIRLPRIAPNLSMAITPL
jgi:hypothetical protein